MLRGAGVGALLVGSVLAGGVLVALKRSTAGSKHDERLAVVPAASRRAGGLVQEMPLAKLRHPTAATLVEAVELESRDQGWAPGMERTLRERFASADLEAWAIPGLRFGAVECRETTCRLEISYPLDHDEMKSRVALPWKKVDALDVYIWRTGRLAPATDSRRAESAASGEVLVRRMVYLGFTEGTRAPPQYLAWVVRSREDIQLQVARLNQGGHSP